MPFKGGIKEAAKILSGLDGTAQERVLTEIAARDPEMAEKLRKNMITFEDLQYLTVKMLVELLQEIDLQDLALGLRIGSSELKESVLKNVSNNMKKEIEDVLLGPPKSVSEVNQSIEKIMVIVRAKAAKGQLIFNKNNDEMV
jgi:flagellar motor switch protein FliG